MSFSANYGISNQVEPSTTSEEGGLARWHERFATMHPNVVYKVRYNVGQCMQLATRDLDALTLSSRVNDEFPAKQHSHYKQENNSHIAVILELLSGSVIKHADLRGHASHLDWACHLKDEFPNSIQSRFFSHEYFQVQTSLDFEPIQAVFKAYALAHGIRTPTKALHKETQRTVGTTTSERLRAIISQQANERGSSFASHAKRLLISGLDEFDSRMDSESSKSVLSEFDAALKQYEVSDTKQWMLRLDTENFIRLRLLAKQYRMSASRISGLFIAQAVSTSMARSGNTSMA